MARVGGQSVPPIAPVRDCQEVCGDPRGVRKGRKSRTARRMMANGGRGAQPPVGSAHCARTLVRSSRSCQSFLTSCGLYFAAFPLLSDTEKINTILARPTGSAWSWGITLWQREDTSCLVSFSSQ
uniref:Uncharacterized protein n=1 Tax=Denticeps clupeoides TaxID=299321 RepID=A0AAY4D5C9_9TELE